MAIVDINVQTAQATAQELNAKGIRSIAVHADITKAKECQRYGTIQTTPAGSNVQAQGAAAEGK